MARTVTPATGGDPLADGRRSSTRRSGLRAALPAALTGLIAACLVAGCGSSSGSTAGPAAPAAQAASNGTDAQTGQALVAYRSALTNLSFLLKAEGELTRRCMQAAGFRYMPAPPAPPSDWDAVSTLTVAAAQRDGYASLIPASGPDTGQESYLAGLSPADQQRYQTALTGDRSQYSEVTVGETKIKAPTTGCQTQTEKELYPDRQTWIAVQFVVTNLRAQKEADTSADPDLLAATAAWRACMKQAGSPFDSPGAAVESAFTSAGSAQAVATDARLRALAVSDAQCRVGAHWDQSNLAATRRGIQRALARHEPEILTYQEIQREAVQRAKKALG